MFNFKSLETSNQERAPNKYELQCAEEQKNKIEKQHKQLEATVLAIIEDENAWKVFKDKHYVLFHFENKPDRESLLNNDQIPTPNHHVFSPQTNTEVTDLLKTFATSQAPYQTNHYKFAIFENKQDAEDFTELPKLINNLNLLSEYAKKASKHNIKKIKEETPNPSEDEKYEKYLKDTKPQDFVTEKRKKIKEIFINQTNTTQNFMRELIVKAKTQVRYLQK